MSDGAQGPNWWQDASGTWHPPEQQPGPVPPPGPGAYPYPQPGGGYQPVAAPRTSGLAIASLVLGIMSIVTCALTGIPGLITGVIARRQIRDSQGAEQGDGLAIGGIVTSIIGLLIVVGFVLAILAITLLGRSASMKFSSVGSVVN